MSHKRGSVERRTFVWPNDDTRMAPFVRMLRLYRSLEHRQWRPPLWVLARDLGVHQRTVRRYLYALERAGCHVPPPYMDPEPQRRRLVVVRPTKEATA